MRLLRRIVRIEQYQESEHARHAAAGSAWSLVWSADDKRLSRVGLGGAPVAADVTVESAGLGAVWWTVTERPPREAGELGDVFDASGVVIGRVVSLSDEAVTVVYHRDAAALGFPETVSRRE